MMDNLRCAIWWIKSGLSRQFSGDAILRCNVCKYPLRWHKGLSECKIHDEALECNISLGSDDKKSDSLIANPYPIDKSFGIGMLSFVKLRAKNIDDEIYRAESFWVKVERIEHIMLTSNPPQDATKYHGKIVDNLTLNVGYKFGETIVFSHDYIWGVEERLHTSYL